MVRRNLPVWQTGRSCMQALETGLEKIAAVAQPSLARVEGATLPDASVEPHWYAAYTCANHEKRVAHQLAERGVEHFLPLYSSVRKWKDRRVWLDFPLFPGYVFVRIALRDRLSILEIPGLAWLVGFGGHPTPLPEDDIKTLHSILVGQLRPEPYAYGKIGQRVRIKSGPLRGLQGKLVRKTGSFRIVVSIESIMRSVSVNVAATDIEYLRR